MSNTADTKKEITKAPNVFGYKLSPEFKKELEEYLNTRPYEETDLLLRKLFEEVPNPEAIYTQQAIDELCNYVTSCPRKEVKDIIIKLNDGKNLQQYTITPKETATANDTDKK